MVKRSLASRSWAMLSARKSGLAAAFLVEPLSPQAVSSPVGIVNGSLTSSSAAADGVHSDVRPEPQCSLIPVSCPGAAKRGDPGSYVSSKPPRICHIRGAGEAAPATIHPPGQWRSLCAHRAWHSKAEGASQMAAGRGKGPGDLSAESFTLSALPTT